MSRWRLATILPWLPLVLFLCTIPVALLGLETEVIVGIAVGVVVIGGAVVNLLADTYLRCPFCGTAMMERDWRDRFKIPRKTCSKCKTDLTEL